MCKLVKDRKGITLIALVITIIILLILAGVTLNGALSENGLFQRAKRATNEYKKAEEEETKAIDEIGEEIDRITFTYNDYVGCYVEGYTPTNGTCKIDATASGCSPNQQDTTGKEIDSVDSSGSQTFNTEGNMGWRIWDYNKSTNTIRLISDKPTETKLTLAGANGYNNGVWAINHICKECYGKENEKGISVANLRRTDIQKVSTYDYTKYKHDENNNFEYEEEETGNIIHFGEEKTYEASQGYPRMWGEHDRNWSYKYEDGTTTGTDDETIWEQEYNSQGKLSGTAVTENTFKQSYYRHDYKGEESEFIKDKYYDLLFRDKSGTSETSINYWLAGRCVDLQFDNCVFGMQTVRGSSEDCVAHGIGLYESNR